MKKKKTHRNFAFPVGLALLPLSPFFGIWGISLALHIGSEQESINPDTAGLCLIFMRANCKLVKLRCSATAPWRQARCSPEAGTGILTFPAAVPGSPCTLWLSARRCLNYLEPVTFRQGSAARGEEQPLLFAAQTTAQTQLACSQHCDPSTHTRAKISSSESYWFYGLQCFKTF